MSFAPPKNRANPLHIRTTIRSFEEWWFDTTRNVSTSGYIEQSPDEFIGELADSNTYGPARAANIRSALRAIPVRNYADYTFIDIGSGKGRALFVAAELPFRRVLGVEFGTALHHAALANIARFSHWRQRCPTIESINANAVEYDFPPENLVLYLCNPFGPELLGRMLSNLEQSIERHPRHILLLLIWPERSEQVSHMRHIQPYKLTRRFHIYQTAG